MVICRKGAIMTRLVLAISTFILVVAMAVGATAAEPKVWERPSTSAPRIGLVIAESGEDVERVEADFAAELGDREATVVRKVVIDDPADEHELRKLEELREEGARLYFFEGPEPARDYLEVRLGDKLETTHPWMTDRGASDALFEAGIFVVRAHLDLGEEGEARRWMKSLVKTLPAHRPDGHAFPPAVVAIWAQTHQRLKIRWATLSPAAGVLQAQCRIVVNGASSKGERLAVAPNRMYLVGQKCEEADKAGHTWVGVAEGERRSVGGFHEAMESEVLELQLEQFAARRHLDSVIYVGPAASCGGEICLGSFRDRLTLHELGEADAGEIVGTQERSDVGR